MGKGLYGFAWTLLRPVYDCIFPRRVKGIENLPAEGGFVLCINHMHARDPLFIATRIPRMRQMFFLAKKELFKVKLLAAIMSGIGAIPVDRGNADLSAVRTALKVLKDGYGLGIFPQGTRSCDNSRTELLTGASMIALRGGVPVIPAYINGPYRMFRRSDISFGKPIELAEYGRRCDSETLSRVTKQIGDAIWALKEPGGEK